MVLSLIDVVILFDFPVFRKQIVKTKRKKCGIYLTMKIVFSKKK